MFFQYVNTIYYITSFYVFFFFLSHGDLSFMMSLHQNTYTIQKRVVTDSIDLFANRT